MHAILRCLWAVPISVAVAWASAQPALAAEAGDILARVEATMNAPKDQVATIEMTLRDADGNTKVRKLTIKQKGSDLRLIKFSSPADVSGVGFLVRSEDEMYLYMPEFGKVRRIASHVKNESFMGTDFSYNDIGETSYTDDYQPTIRDESETSVVLELTPTEPDESDYSKLLMTVDTTRNLPTKVEFYDKKGKLWKVMIQEEVEKVSSYWAVKRVTMTDKRKDHSTVMALSDVKFDTGLSDKDFSRRRLKRSR